MIWTYNFSFVIRTPLVFFLSLYWFADVNSLDYFSMNLGHSATHCTAIKRSISLEHSLMTFSRYTRFWLLFAIYLPHILHLLFNTFLYADIKNMYVCHNCFVLKAEIEFLSILLYSYQYFVELVINSMAAFYTQWGVKIKEEFPTTCYMSTQNCYLYKDCDSPFQVPKHYAVTRPYFDTKYITFEDQVVYWYFDVHYHCYVVVLLVRQFIFIFKIYSFNIIINIMSYCVLIN